MTSTASGILFGLAWWILIDAIVATKNEPVQFSIPVVFGFYVPGIGVTLTFLMINGIDWSGLTGDEMSHSGTNGAFGGLEVQVKALLDLTRTFCAGATRAGGAFRAFRGSRRERQKGRGGEASGRDESLSTLFASARLSQPAGQAWHSWQLALSL